MNLWEHDCWRDRVPLAGLRSRARMAIAALLLFSWCIRCEVLAAADPLATCKLQTIANQTNQQMSVSVIGVLAQPQADGSLGYRRGVANDWLVAESIDPNDAVIRGLLMTPAGPLLVTIEVQIDGRPFRELSEQWIDRALQHAGSNPKDSESPDVSAPDSADTDNSTESPKPVDSTVPKNRITPQKFQAVTPVEWLTEYVRNATGTVDRTEARWLLAQRSGGPALMELVRFSTSRSTAAPLVQFIDLDSDGVLSASEIQQIDDRLAACDFNQDGNVDLAELERSRPRKISAYRVWRAEPLFVVVSDQTDWQDVERSMKTLYSETTVPAKNAAALKRQAEGEPAFSVRVRLGKNDSTPGVELVQLSGAQDAGNSIRTGKDVIAIDLGHSDVEISAGQAGEPQANGQVSIGAVTEGLPLWSLVDTDNDNRLSVRERSNVKDMLASLDQNQDGTLSANEIPTRIRLAVALGPTVHQLLARRAPTIPRRPVTSRAEAPDWFASMDANKDGDLTVEEFFGTPEQFKTLDLNGDGLLSLKEAGQAAPPK